jgi:hypothetical protein
MNGKPKMKDLLDKKRGEVKGTSSRFVFAIGNGV